MACLFALPITAQETDNTTPPPITAENITQLESVAMIPFEDEMNVDSGWFILSDDGQRIAVVHQQGGMLVFDPSGEVVLRTQIEAEDDTYATVLDAEFAGETLVVLLRRSEDYLIGLYEGEQETIIEVEVGLDMPVRVWLDESGDYVWLEVLALQADHYVMGIPIEGDEAILTLPSGPENDETAFVRIGRIEAPLAITATQDGLTKRWNLETGEVTAEVQVDQPPVFGRIDETNGRHLAWRDPASESLYLLDFETGENQEIAPLFGEYVQAFTLTPDASVILAVGIEDRPEVVAWDVATGERYEIGEYQECTRVPDMVRLSTDGTTLVIGCDAGLDIWQILAD